MLHLPKFLGPEVSSCCSSDRLLDMQLAGHLVANELRIKQTVQSKWQMYPLRNEVGSEKGRV